MTLTTKRIWIITLAVCLLLGVVWYFALWEPQSGNLKKAHAARAAALGQVNTLQDQVYGLEALVRQIPYDQKEMATLKTALPDNPDLADVLNQLKKVADSTGVTLTSVTPSAPGGTANASGPPSITLELSISGTYQQTVAFLEGLDALPRATTIRNLSISGTTNALTTSMTAYIFYADSSDTSGASSNLDTAPTTTPTTTAQAAQS